MAGKPEVRVSDTAVDLFRAAAEEFFARASQAIDAHAKFTVALSGGSTPKGLFHVLASDYGHKLAWDKVLFFWGDERHVPPDSSESNYRMANEALLSHVSVDPENVFRIPAEGKDADAVAHEYEKTIQRAFALKNGEFPRFDLILLGMGPDGHTASLFPGTKALTEVQKIFVANRVEKLNTFRFTLTYPAIDNAAHVIFLTSGTDKAGMLKQVFEESADEAQADTEKHPAARINPAHGKLLWMVDKAAAQSLPLILRNLGAEIGLRATTSNKAAAYQSLREDRSRNHFLAIITHLGDDTFHRFVVMFRNPATEEENIQAVDVLACGISQHQR